MPFRFFLLVSVLIGGCSGEPTPGNPAVYSDPAAYHLQSVVHPHGLEPNVTPYGTPTNAAGAGEYDRPLRTDAVSNYLLLPTRR
jgi:hypothetical protein